MGCLEFEPTKFESKAQLGWGYVGIDSEQFVQRGLTIPRAPTIANVEVIPQRLATQVDCGDPETVADDFCGYEQIPLLVFPGLRGVADLSLESVPPSFVTARAANVDLCAYVRCLDFHGEAQFVARANERGQDIRHHDGSAICKSAFGFGAFGIRLKNRPPTDLRL
jgi:hypothetical protein